MNRLGLDEAFLNFYEQGMRTRFTLLYNYYNHSRLEFLKNLENQDLFTSRFYTFLCSYANNPKVIEVFQHIKDLVVSELFYNQNYWRVKEGYIEEKNENLADYLEEIDDVACGFVVAMIEYQREKNLSDTIFDTLLAKALDDLYKINEQYGETDARLSAIQFAELLLIRSLIPKMEAVKDKNFTLIS